MARKHPRLLLERETKLHSLLPGWNEDDRLEASGVLALGEGTCCVVFDNLNRVARIHTSFEDPAANLLVDCPSPGPGFEDIAFDSAERRFYLLVEAMREADGASRARVVEFDEDFAFRGSSVLDRPFECENRGFEGLAHVRLASGEFLWHSVRATCARTLSRAGDASTSSSGPRIVAGSGRASCLCRPAPSSRTTRPSRSMATG